MKQLPGAEYEPSTSQVSDQNLPSSEQELGKDKKYIAFRPMLPRNKIIYGLTFVFNPLDLIPC